VSARVCACVGCVRKRVSASPVTIWIECSVGACVRVCVCVCVCVRVAAFARGGVCVCARVGACVRGRLYL
jgi:hypothetical protein